LNAFSGLEFSAWEFSKTAVAFVRWTLANEKIVSSRNYTGDNARLFRRAQMFVSLDSVVPDARDSSLSS
jgi:hypothetical protein